MKIVKGRFTKKMWVENSRGRRITKKYAYVCEEKECGVFKVIYQQDVGCYPIRIVFDTRTETIKLKYIDYSEVITEDLISFKYGSKRHLYNAKGELLRADVENLWNNKAVRLLKVRIDGKWYFMDYNLKVISIGYAAATDFDEFGYSVVKLCETGHCGVINTNMQFVVQPFECNGINSLSKNCFEVEKDSKYGVVDITGKEIIPAVYSDIWLVSGYFKVKYNGKFGLLDKAGKTIFDCIYPEIIETPDKFVVQDFSKLEVSKTKEVIK